MNHFYAQINKGHLRKAGESSRNVFQKTTIKMRTTVQKMVLDAALPSTQHYKVRIKGKVEQSWEWSSAFPYTSV